MFGLFKKSKENNEEKKEITIDHPLMGRLTFDDYQWVGKYTCHLFGTEKEIGLEIHLDNDKADDPLKMQETAYSYYAENADKINSKIESELRYASETEDDLPLSSRFEPVCFIIFPDSSCGISFRDHEIEDEYSDAAYVVVSIRPRIVFKGSEHDYYGL